MENYQQYTYSVIPTIVLDDERLSAKEVLLYARISSLCNKHGFCFASNQYFANKTKNSISTIKRMLKNLIDTGYITSFVVYKKNSKEIEQRQIRLTNCFSENLSLGVGSPVSLGGVTDEPDNNININNISINNMVSKFEPHSLKQIEEYCEERNNGVNTKTTKLITSGYLQEQKPQLINNDAYGLKSTYPMDSKVHTNRSGLKSTYKDSSINNYSIRYIEEESSLIDESKNNHLEVKSNIKKRITKVFVPPSLKEVEDFCIERNNNVNAKKFYDYYSVNDWKDQSGKQIKNWKQKMIAVWEKNNNSSPSNGSQKEIFTQEEEKEWQEFERLCALNDKKIEENVRKGIF